MLDQIKLWINNFYMNNYQFDEEEFLRIIDEFADILPTFQPDEIMYINNILQKIIDKYTIKDYFYVVEIFEYEFVPLFVD